MKVLVTGATGFIGSHLVKELKNQEHEVTCFVRKASNIDKFKKLNVDFAYGDIQDKKSLEEVVEGKEVIYHLIGIGSLSANSKEEFKKFYDINVLGTKNLLNAVLSKNPSIKKVIYLSSTAAVGLQNGIIVNEETVCNPVTPYQKSKYESEKSILDYYEKYGLPITIIRPCMVYGPGNPYSEILHMCKFIKKGIFPLFNDGNNSVPLVYVADLVQGIVLAAEKGRCGEIYFITNDNISSMDQIVDAISQTMGVKVFRIRIPKRLAKFCAYILENIALMFRFKPIITRERIESMTTDRIFSIEKAKKEFGYIPKINLKNGIKKTIDWYKEKGYL